MTKQQAHSTDRSAPATAESDQANQALRRRIDDLQQAHQEIKNRNRRLDAQLLKAQEDLAAILKSVSDALLVTDLQGRLVDLNPEAERFLAIERRQAVGKPICSVLRHPELGKGIRLALQDACGGHNFEFKERRLGQDRTYQASASASRGASGIQRGLVVLVRNISALRELDRLKSEFLSTAGHKLRAPMTSIVGFSEILLTRPNLHERDKKRYLQLIHDESRQLSELVDDLIDVSRIESEQGLPMDFEEVQIEDLLRAEAQALGAFRAGHDFKLIFAGALPPVRCDPLRVRQALRHLLSNAVKYSPGGGEIRVTATAEQGWMRVSIADQGIGMSPDQIGHAFEKFYRADSSNTAVEGTGLGLSITKSIVESHNGGISIESELSKGTTVKLSLPLELEKQQILQLSKELVEASR